MMGFSFMLLVWPSFTCKLIIKVSLGPSNMLGDQVKKKSAYIHLIKGLCYFEGKKKTDFDISLLFLLLGFDFELLSS
jgi:hypothetical protein